MPASSPASSASSPGGRHRMLAVVVAGVLVAALVATWALTRSTGDDPERTAGPPPSTAAVDLSTLSVPRTAFCDRLAGTDVRGALDAPVAGRDEYRSGDRVLLAPGVRDVSHEFGCVFDATTGAQARVWVFAEPVSQGEAAGIGRGVRRAPRCRPLDARPAFGRSPAGTVCKAATPYGQQVTLRGLFGDAWLSCQVTTAGSERRAEVVQRGSRWCVRVATSLGGP